MDDKEYWETRARQRELMGEKSADELLQTMKPVYKNSLADINKEIEAFYGRYAENNQLSLSEVHKRLDPKELKSAKEEIKKYYDSIDKLARNNNGEVDVNLLREYKDELRLQSAKAYMSRLEELKLNLKNITVNLGVEESKAYYQTLSKIYSDTYKKTSYDMDKFLGFSTGFEGLNYKKLNSAIHQPWLGMNFSDRIWNNKGKLLDQINTTFLQGVAQGQNPRKIAETMSKNMGTSYYNCERLARTECAHIMGEATLQGYKDRNIDEYKFEATLDGRTSDICQSLDGEVFKLKEAQEGVNYPPMHPNCRSTTIPYFKPDDIDKMFDEAQRVARDENGDLYYVPASMTYKEWEKTMNHKPAMTVNQIVKAIQNDNYSENYEENKTWLQNQFNKASITENEKTVIEGYSENDFTLINRNLRYNRYNPSSNSDMNTKITTLIKAIDKSKVGKNIVVWRGAESDFIDTILGRVVSDIPKNEINKVLTDVVKKGIEFEEKGMMSTSIHPEGAHGKTMMKINVPKDARGLYIESITKKKTSSWEHPEDELLLQRGYKLKIKHVNYNEQTFQYEVDADLIIK